MSDLFAYYEKPLRDFLLDAVRERASLVKIVIQYADLELIESLAGVCPAVSVDFKHVLDNYAVHHTMMKHASEKEEFRGQVRVEIDDFLMLPEILTEYDAITLTSRNGKQIIIYEKSYATYTCHLVEEVRKGRKELAVITLYKTRKGRLTGADS